MPSNDPRSAAPAAFAGFYPGRPPIDSYGGGGFRFAGMSHRGSILIGAEGVEAWPVDAPAMLDGAAAAELFARLGALGLLLLGTGRSQVFPDVGFSAPFVEAGVTLEVMDTGAAARTYNILLAEGRPVGAALIAVGEGAAR